MALALRPGASSGRPLTWGRTRGSVPMEKRRRDFSSASGDLKALGAFFCNFLIHDLRQLERRGGTLSRAGGQCARRRRSRGACGDRRDGEIMAGSKLFSKLFQISHVFLQAFPKKALVVLWNFNGLQGFQTQRAAFQIIRRARLPFGLAPNAVAPHSTDSAVAIRVCSAVRRAAGLRGARSGLAFDFVSQNTPIALIRFQRKSKGNR